MNEAHPPKPARRSRPMLRWTVLLVGLGALTTAATAWTAAYLVQNLDGAPRARSGERLVDASDRTIPHPADGQAPPGTRKLRFGVYELPGVTFGISSVERFQNYTPTGAPLPVTPEPEQVATRWERAELLPWSTGARPWPTSPARESIWVKAAGWPFRSFVCNLKATNAPDFRSHTWSARGGLILDNPVRASWADWPPMFPIIIPLRPMWPELLANIGIYSAAWGLLLLPLTYLLRARRRRRGHCRRCNYDLTALPPHLPCPECGTPQRPKPVSQSQTSQT